MPAKNMVHGRGILPTLGTSEMLPNPLFSFDSQLVNLPSLEVQHFMKIYSAIEKSTHHC